MKKGFTLAELSIALVVIGLLIGGILVAQTMIGTARVQAQIRQLQQFDIATSNFILNFNKLPGDGGLTGAGADGYIRYNTQPDKATLSDVPGFYEALYFFPVLSQRGMIRDNYVYSSVDRITGIGHQFPKAEIGVGGVTISGGYNGEIFYMLGPKYNLDATCATYCDQYSKIFQDGVSIQNWGIVMPKQALAMDTKIDDGLPNSGIMRSVGEYSGGPNSNYGTPAFPQENGTCSISAQYNVNLSESNARQCLITYLSGATRN